MVVLNAIPKLSFLPSVRLKMKLPIKMETLVFLAVLKVVPHVMSLTNVLSVPMMNTNLIQLDPVFSAQLNSVADVKRLKFVLPSWNA